VDEDAFADWVFAALPDTTLAPTDPAAVDAFAACVLDDVPATGAVATPADALAA
jgi:hypothetical protein